jgi:YfiR/HmsC-like
MGDAMQANICSRMERHHKRSLLTAHNAGSRICLPSLDRFVCTRWLLAMIVACGVCFFVSAQSVEEHEVKAAFVLKLINFVQWPDVTGHRNSVVIGILGTGPTSDSLERLASGKSVDGREIVVRRLNTESDLTTCQVIFVGGSERNNVASVLARVRGASILTVGEMDGFGQHGGVVNLMLDEGRIRLEVNPNAAQRAHLQISSRLLSLATIVRDGT